MTILKNRLFLASILLTSAVLLGACTPGNLLSNDKSSPENEPEAAELDALSRAVALGQSVRCTDLNAAEDDGLSEYLVKDGRMKINSTDPETQVTNHFLIMENSSYFWADNEETGYMFTADPETTADAVETVENLKQMVPDVDFDQEQEPQADEKAEFDCQEAEFADSEFELPKNVNFVSPAEMFQESINQAQQELQNQAGELTEEQQQQLDQFLQQMEN